MSEVMSTNRFPGSLLIRQTPSMRLGLIASAVFTLSGAVMFGWPSSFAGRIAALPAGVPAIYRYLAALFMLLFGGAYAWLAMQPWLARAFVVFGTLGKLAAFAGMTALWLGSQIEARTYFMVSGDLVFAAWFAMALRAPASRAMAGGVGQGAIHGAGE
ncbi:hypothetical protein L2Y94_00150 [Luteibacter aegosomatis]|uniref:hypothetical protein n=1 Tax=Luteibacter aegosomatis TaxID=2911537 RepID=UPI001FFB98B8|nr:hypothetical protein [Luteibacter aegosomatis]UPG85809.1 hypothetical protein L2Y94_00150 [Luteibacter aegosomatis]